MSRLGFLGCAAFILCWVAGGRAEASQEVTQTFQLQPGWNAVFVEVEPADNETSSVFAGLPIDSVWSWSPKTSPVEFVSDPSEVRLRETGWLGFYPSSRPEAFLGNLFRLQANRPYLIKLAGSDPLTWALTGRPAWQPTRWVPDSFNLVGGRVDPVQPPTFGQYFAASVAHDGQPVYRLDEGGTWQQTSPDSAMRSGEAFWIFTAGSSDYASPMHVRVAAGDGIDFGSGLTRLEVKFDNRGVAPAAYSARLLTPGPISFQTFDAAEIRYTWRPLDGVAVVTAGPGEQAQLSLAVRRSDLAGDVFDSVVEVTDGAGSRRLLPLRARQLGVSARSAPGGVTFRRGKSVHALAGLWVGTASLDEVSALPAASGGGAPPLESTLNSTFDLRLLIHVDDSGQVRLLEDVILMWQDGTPPNPGHFVLVTRDDEIANFQGSTVVDGEQVGRRISTAAYDFDVGSVTWDATSETVALTGGSFGAAGDTLDTTITLSPNHPSNPFYHRYHPQHDQDCGCDELFVPGTPEHTACNSGCMESFGVDRSIQLTFVADDPTVSTGEPPNPDWGVARVAGTYAESLVGLHRLPLATAGSFTLRRVSDRGVLNQ